MKKRVMAAMSGGVDSSVTAAILLDSGYEVIGITMKLIDDTSKFNSSDKTCCGYDAAIMAKRVCDKLGIPHYTVDTSELFREVIIENFVSEYKNGRTPNPCVRCNEFLKFDYLFLKADELSCDFLATGHYSKIQDNTLLKGDDPDKDQSYFLYPVYKSSINRILFPLGSMKKNEVRSYAAARSLPSAQKKESQDICFIPDGRYSDFLSSRMSFKEGKILNTKGETIGRHTGVQNFTIGQRKGLGAQGKPMYVVALDTSANIVIAGTSKELYTREFLVSDTIMRKPYDKLECDVQIRYNSTAVKASIKQCGNNEFRVTTHEPVKSASPGQSAVFFSGDRVEGGGLIKNVNCLNS